MVFLDRRYFHMAQLLTNVINPGIVRKRLGDVIMTATSELNSHATKAIQNNVVGTLDNAGRGHPTRRLFLA
jgi:RNA-binding protein YlmH